MSLVNENDFKAVSEDEAMRTQVVASKDSPFASFVTCGG